MTDSGSHFYDVYECADGGWLAVGPIEAGSTREFLQTLGIDPAALGPQNDRATLDPGKEVIAGDKFRERPRDDWAAMFAADRRVRRAGARLGRSAAARAPCSAWHVRRSGRRRATCAGAALQRDAAGNADTARPGHAARILEPRSARGCRATRSTPGAARGLID